VGAGALIEAATAVLDCYDAWASTIDDFAPVKIDHDVAGLITHPEETERGLLTANGSGVVYACRVDLLAVDAADEYWVVRHQIVDDWQDPDSLVRDEEAIAACWAWEQDYVGMEIVGTIHNEVRISGPLGPPRPRAPKDTNARRLPSMSPAVEADRFRNISGCRRWRHGSTSRAGSTSAPRGPCAAPASVVPGRRIAAVGGQLAVEALDMVSEPAIYPSPAAHCSVCEFAAPCLALVRRRRSRAGPGSAVSPAAGERAAQAAVGAVHLGLRQGSRSAAVGTPITVALTYISVGFSLGVVHAFDVLGDPVRRRILELLVDGEMSAGSIGTTIQDEFAITQPAVSQHLKVLRDNGFASVRPDGQRRLYAVNGGALRDVDEWLDAFRRFWTPHLDALGTEIARGETTTTKEGNMIEIDVDHQIKAVRRQHRDPHDR